MQGSIVRVYSDAPIIYARIKLKNHVLEHRKISDGNRLSGILKLVNGGGKSIDSVFKSPVSKESVSINKDVLNLRLKFEEYVKENKITVKYCGTYATVVTAYGNFGEGFSNEYVEWLESKFVKLEKDRKVLNGEVT